MFALAERVGPLVDLMRRRVLESLVLGVDETPDRMLSLAALSSVKSYLRGTVSNRKSRTLPGPGAWMATTPALTGCLMKI